MKIKNLILLSIFAGLVFTGCKKDKDEDPVDPFNSKYSELSDETNKENLEDAGIQMINEIDQLKEADAIEIAINFASKAEAMDEAIATLVPAIDIIASLSEKDYGAKETLNALKSATAEPNSLSELWAELVGKYTWNASMEDWDYTELANAIVFEFPGMEGDITNTASLTVDNFSAVTISNPAIEMEDGSEAELPTSLRVDLKYNGTSVAGYNLTASYLEDGMPTTINSVLTIAAFSYTIGITHSPYTDASFTTSFKHDGQVLIEAHLDANGNWSEDNIESLTNDENEVPPVENVLSQSNAYIQILNIKVAGKVDVEKLAPALRSLDTQYPEYNDQISLEFNQKLADIVNEHISLVVVYADNNQKIAEAEAYPYYDEYWEEYWLDFRFVFSDGSKADAETYFGEGFSDLIDAMNDFIADLNDEYGTDIDYIEE
jgi:hypothetical protein